MKVRMKVGISGGRADGTEWPAAGGTLEVGDREGAELCAAGIAEPVAEIEEPAETPESALNDSAETRAAAPPPNAPKAAWVDHAVAGGMDPAAAAALTKQQLIVQTSG